MALRQWWEGQGELEQPAAAHEHLTKVGAAGDLADLVPDPVGDQRRARIVEHDALLAVDPARILVDLGPDQPEPEWGHAVAQTVVARVEHLALPDQGPDHRGRD